MLQYMQKGFLAGFFICVLVLAAFSLVLSDWTGSFRGGVGSTHVAEIGSMTISQNEFAGLAERTLRNEQIGLAQAYQMGLIHRLLSSEIWQRMMEDRAGGLGVMVDDKTLITHLEKLAAPIAASEKIPVSQVVRRFIESQGVTEPIFLSTLRRDLSNDVMKRAIGGVTPVSTLLAQDVARAEGQTRSVSYVLLRDADVTGIGDPTPEQLTAFYGSQQNKFMNPERRTAKLAILPRTAMTKDVTVTDADIQTFYDDHQDELQRPESRTLLVATSKDQDAIKSFEKNVVGQMNEAAWTKAGVQTKEITVNPATAFDKSISLPSYLEKAFTAAAGQVVGPVQSPLGWHLIGVASIKPAGLPALTDVREKIQAQILEDRTSIEIDRVLEELNAAYERGETLAEANKKFGLTTTSLNDIDREGRTANDQDALKDKATIKPAILTALFGSAETNRVLAPAELSTGDVALMEIETINAAAPKPIEAVRDTLIKDWRTEQKRQANMMAAQAFLPDLVSGQRTVKDIAAARSLTVDRLNNVTRNQKDLPAMVDPAAWARVFDTDIGTPILTPVPGGIFLAQVESVTLADIGKQPKEAHEQTLKGLAQAQAQEQITQFMGALAEIYAPQVNDRLLKAMFDRGE